MSDSEPTELSVSPSDPWQQQERELARIAKEVLPVNKKALFDALAAAGITMVIVNFDGCGDIAGLLKERGQNQGLFTDRLCGLSANKAGNQFHLT